MCVGVAQPACQLALIGAMIVDLGLFILLIALGSTQGTLYKYDQNEIEVNFNENRLRVDFWGPPHHITLTDAVKDEFVVFFGSDTDRPLDYSCGHHCEIYLEQNVYSADSVTLSASVQLTSPPPSATGVLQLCTGPKETFWKRPLVKETKISCVAWNRSYSPRIGGFIIQPNIHVQDSCELEVYTWYMTKEDYDEMRVTDTTVVTIPLFDKPYWLPIVTVFYHGSRNVSVTCYFKTPFYTERIEDDADSAKTEGYSLVYKYTNYIEAVEENSGVYIVSCSGWDWDDFAQRSWNIELSKSLHINFIRGPKVYIEGQSDHTLIVPFLNTSMTFNILVYSTSPVSTFNIEKTDGVANGGETVIVTSSETHSPFSIVVRNRIEIPSVTDDISGTYTVAVVNEDGESVTQNIDVIRATEIHVVVSPPLLIVGEGDRVSFDCLGIGSIVDSISWQRDFEDISPDKYNVHTEEIGHDRQRGIRLTFPSVRMDYSGTFVCTASNQFQTKRSTVGLSVWPSGSPIVEDDHYSSLVTVSQHESGGHTLNISNHDLQLEWMDYSLPSGGLSKSSLVLAALTVLMAGALLLIGVIAGVWYGRQLLLMKNRDVSGDYDHHTSTSVIPTPPTAPKVTPDWNLIRKESLQLDKTVPAAPAKLKSSPTIANSTEDVQQLIAVETVNYDSELEKNFMEFDEPQRLSGPDDEAVPLLSMETNEEAAYVKHKSKSKKSKKSKRSESESRNKVNTRTTKEETTKRDKGRDKVKKNDKSRDAVKRDEAMKKKDRRAKKDKTVLNNDET